MNVDRDADAAVEARIRIGWNKFSTTTYCLPISMYRWLWEELRKVMQQLCVKQYDARKWDLACKERQEAQLSPSDRAMRLCQ